MSSLFKIFSPEDCDFYYNGELKGHIEANSEKAFPFEVEKRGTYRVKFVNSRYNSELRMKLEIGADEEQDIELDFTEVNEAFIKAEEEKEKQRLIEAEKLVSEKEAERIRVELEKQKLAVKEAEVKLQLAKYEEEKRIEEKKDRKKQKRLKESAE
jgi:hypothetical protein